MPVKKHVLTLIGTLAAAVSLTHVAEAGPPLICQPFIVEGESLLPWTEGRRDWHSPDLAYDIENLVTDALRLLAPDTPVLARMENLRRATIYAADDVPVANALLAAVLERAQQSQPDVASRAAAWFDAGYLIEAYRQHGMIDGLDMIASFRSSRQTALAPEIEPLDGYAFVQKAIALAPASAADMEFAASLMSRNPAAERHLARAKAGASEGSLLATNLARD